MTSRSSALSSVACAVGIFISARASAEEPRWRPEWPHFRAAEVAFTGGLTLQVAAGAFLYHAPTRNWEGGILFDDPIRDALRFQTRGARTAAASTSDVLYYALLAYPLVDAPVVGGVRGDREVAIQTLAINLEAYAFTGAFALTAEKAGRARPSAAECERDSSYDPRCDDVGRLNSSFLSGHTALAFAGAGLTCVHHLNLPLYGGSAADVVACAAALTAATTSGMLRIHSDNHYATDVLLGGVVGLGGGYLLPWLLHYRSRTTPAASLLPTYERDGVRLVLAPTMSSTALGAVVLGAL